MSNIQIVKLWNVLECIVNIKIGYIEMILTIIHHHYYEYSIGNISFLTSAIWGTRRIIQRQQTYKISTII